MLALSAGRIGISPAAIAAYYRGGSGEMSFPKELWQLMEEAHFHLFSIPIVLLILTHLLFATVAHAAPGGHLAGVLDSAPPSRLAHLSVCAI